MVTHTLSIMLQVTPLFKKKFFRFVYTTNNCAAFFYWSTTHSLSCCRSSSFNTTLLTPSTLNNPIEGAGGDSSSRREKNPFPYNNLLIFKIKRITKNHYDKYLPSHSTIVVSWLLLAFRPHRSTHRQSLHQTCTWIGAMPPRLGSKTPTLPDDVQMRYVVSCISTQWVRIKTY